MSRLFNMHKLSAILVIAILFLLFTNTTYFEVQYSLLERGFVGLSFALGWGLVFARKSRVFLPIPMLLLVFAMGLSVTQFLQAYIAEDFLGMSAIAASAIVMGSLVENELIVLGITLGAFLLSIWVISSIFLTDSSWTQDGKLIGPFSHWNVLGLTLLFTVPAIISNLFKKQSLVIYIFSAVTLTLVVSLIYFSESRTSWISLFCILITSLNIWAYKFKKKIGIAISLAIVISGLLFALFREALLGFLRKGENLSGRTDIWGSLISHFWDKPFLGNGWARVFHQIQIFFGKYGQTLVFKLFIVITT